MANRTRYEVTPNGTKWNVSRNGAVVATYGTKQEAVDYAQGRAQADQPSQLLIKRANGTIEDERTYGNDPYPPRG
jgi:hypothetical protein